MLILTVLMMGSCGRTAYSTCFIDTYSSGHIVELFPLSINFPLILLFNGLSFRKVKKNYEPLLAGLAISNFLLVLTLAGSNIMSFVIEYKNGAVTPVEVHFAAMIGACSGLVLSASKLFNKKLFAKLKKKFKPKPVKVHNLDDFYEKEARVNFLDSSIWNLSDFFDNITKKTVAEILITLFIRFHNEIRVKTSKKLIISYPIDKYKQLESQFPYIEHCNILYSISSFYDDH